MLNYYNIFGTTSVLFSFFNEPGHYFFERDPKFSLFKLGLKDKMKIIGLALAGFLGFGIGWLIANNLSYRYDWWLQAIVRFTLSGIIGGALLGATLGYLERE